MLLKDNHIADDPLTSLLISSSFKDNNNAIMSVKPLLSKASSFNNSIGGGGGGGGVSCFYQKRRRRAASDDSLSCVSNDSSERSSFGRDVRHVASETFLVTRLALKMLTYLGYETYSVIYLSM